MIRALAAALQERCAAVERVAAMARDEASGEESRAEGQYDTRATEASYLARGQAERVTELRRALAWAEAAPDTPCTQVDVGALVDVELRGRREVIYLAPMTAASFDVGAGSGVTTIRVVAMGSPLGLALTGAGPGDEVELDGPQGGVICAVIEVA